MTRGIAPIISCMVKIPTAIIVIIIITLLMVVITYWAIGTERIGPLSLIMGRGPAPRRPRGIQESSQGQLAWSGLVWQSVVHCIGRPMMKHVRNSDRIRASSTDWALISRAICWSNVVRTSAQPLLGLGCGGERNHRVVRLWLIPRQPTGGGLPRAGRSNLCIPPWCLKKFIWR